MKRTLIVALLAMSLLVIAGASWAGESAAAKLAVVKPVAGATFIQGSTQMIEWAANGVKADLFEILLSEDGGKSYPTQLAMLDAKEFKSQWRWKVGTAPSAICRIKVAAHSAITMLQSAESDLFAVTVGAEAVQKPGHPEIEGAASGVAAMSAGDQAEGSDQTSAGVLPKDKPAKPGVTPKSPEVTANSAGDQAEGSDQTGANILPKDKPAKPGVTPKSPEVTANSAGDQAEGSDQTGANILPKDKPAKPGVTPKSPDVTANSAGDQAEGSDQTGTNILPKDKPAKPGVTPKSPEVTANSAPQTEPRDALPISGAITGDATNPITLMAPNGGEQFHRGENVMIKWTGVRDHSSVKYAIMFRAAPQKSWKPLVENLAAGSSEWSWNIQEKSAKECYIRIVATVGGNEFYDDCDKSFSIATSTKAKSGVGQGN